VVEAWVVVAVLGGATTVIGWLVSRITTQNEVIRTQKTTIDTQARSLDMMEITGRLQDKMLQVIPSPRGGPER
jgi:hypothetical protein